MPLAWLIRNRMLQSCIQSKKILKRLTKKLLDIFCRYKFSKIFQLHKDDIKGIRKLYGKRKSSLKKLKLEKCGGDKTIFEYILNVRNIHSIK